MDSDTTKAIYSALSVTLELDNECRRQAEQQLKALEILESYPLSLLNILMNEDVSNAIRNLAGLTLRNYIVDHWRETDLFGLIPPEVNEELITRQTPSNGPIFKSVESIFCYISMVDWPIHWPSMFTDVMHAAKSIPVGVIESNRHAVDQCMHILSNLSLRLSPFDVLPIIPYIMPDVVRIFNDKQKFSLVSRRCAIDVADNILCKAVKAKNAENFGQFLQTYIGPLLGLVVEELVNLNDDQLNTVQCKSKCLSLLTNVCLNGADFVATHFSPILDQLMPLFLDLFGFCVKHDVINADEEERLARVCYDDPYDDEPHIYDTFVGAVLDCLSGFISSPHYKNRFELGLDEFCFYIFQLAQMTKECVDHLTSSIEDYTSQFEREQSTSIVKLIKKIATTFPNAPAALKRSMCRIFILAEDVRNNGNPDWWKLFEVNFDMCSRMAAMGITLLDSSSSIASSRAQLGDMTYEAFCANYLEPSLQQTDYCFLQTSAFNCLEKLVQLKLASESHVRSFPSLLVTAMSSRQSAYLRIMAVYALDSIKPHCGHPAAGYIVPHLPDLFASVLDCIGEFGHLLLDVGLRDLCHLLRFDPDRFAVDIASQFVPNLVTFKDCLKPTRFPKCHYNARASIDYYPNLVRIMYVVTSANMPRFVEEAFLPTILSNFENECENCGLENSLKVLCALIGPAQKELSPVMMQRIFPLVVDLAMSESNINLLTWCCDVLRRFLTFGLKQVIDWCDDEGNNGISYILQVTSRLLNPSQNIDWGQPAGQLVCTIFSVLDDQQLGENMDLLLRGVLARFGALNAVERGKAALEEILLTWCKCQHRYKSKYEVHVSVVALANLVMYALTSNDERLLTLNVQEPLVDSGGSDADPPTELSITMPLVVKLYQLILDQLKVEMEKDKTFVNTDVVEVGGDEECESGSNIAVDDQSSTDDYGFTVYMEDATVNDDNDNDDDDDDDDDFHNDPRFADPIYSKESIMNIDMKEYLVQFLAEFSQHPSYNDFSRFHSPTELLILKKVSILP